MSIVVNLYIINQNGSALQNVKTSIHHTYTCFGGIGSVNQTKTYTSDTNGKISFTLGNTGFDCSNCNNFKVSIEPQSNLKAASSTFQVCSSYNNSTFKKNITVIEKSKSGLSELLELLGLSGTGTTTSTGKFSISALFSGINDSIAETLNLGKTDSMILMIIVALILVISLFIIIFKVV
jgi:hypothetical protein